MGDSDHTSKLQADESHQPGQDNGCVTRCVYDEQGGKRVCKFAGHNYVENGFNYQLASESSWYNLDLYRAGEAQDRYKQIFIKENKQPWRDPLKVDKVWHMGAGPYAGLNFIGSGWWPWANNAHHIVSVDDVLSKVLDANELLILQTAKYNVNKGLNIIFLPKSSRHGRLYFLLKHPKYHSTYSAQARIQVDAIKRRIEAAANKEKEEHPDLSPPNLPNLGKQLETFSLRTRKDLREAGTISPGAHINELFNILSSR